MKTIAMLLFILIGMITPLQAQTDSISLNKFYHTWIIPNQGHKVMSGILYEIKDSSVMVSNSPWKKDYYEGKYKVSEFDISNIDVIKVRRQGKGFAILIGGVSGMILGGVISAAYMNHLIKNMNPWGLLFGGYMLAAIPMIVSTGCGLGVGAIIASKKTIAVKGSQEKYDWNKNKLNEYALKNNPSLKFVSVKSFSILRDSVSDIDGNVYHTLALGGQVWMSENLKATRYRDSSEISYVTKNAGGYGLQYHWFAVSDSRKLCPAGWHVPSFAEWTSLFNSLGGENGAADKLKESFSAMEETGQWWSSTETDTDHAQSIYLNNKTTRVMFTSTAKKSNLSVRCIRD